MDKTHIATGFAASDGFGVEIGYRKSYADFYSWSSIMKRRPHTDVGQIAAYFQFQIFYRKYGKVLSRLGKAFGMRKAAGIAKFLAYGGEKRGMRLEKPSKVEVAVASRDV